jgi:hypothetical protein
VLKASSFCEIISRINPDFTRQRRNRQGDLLCQDSAATGRIDVAGSKSKRRYSFRGDRGEDEQHPISSGQRLRPAKFSIDIAD